MNTPASTYRFQIRESFTLFDAAKMVPYLQKLGIDWVYVSPILTAEAGSDHGYDVTDPTTVDPSRGGEAGLAALSQAVHAAGMGLLVDIVPNHMGVATASANKWWWDLLTHGQESRYAEAFDIDWAAGGGKVRLPVLGDSPDELEALEYDDAARLVRYYDKTFPLAPGTEASAAGLAEQHYELVSWREADATLNYRRFFGVTTLAGVRVEVPWVFDESHQEIKRWFDEGLVDGLRVDHPDGLADPRGYLERLSEITGGAYVLVEKILEPGEQLPESWACAGTTGYDALADVDRLFVDPAGREILTDMVPVERYAEMTHDTKRAIADGLLNSEVRRLARLVPADLLSGSEDSASAGPDFESLVDALAEILASFPVYRSYLPDDGAAHLELAILSARVHRPDLAEVITALHEALLPAVGADGESRDGADVDGAMSELALRFQQTSGMVMAKGVEDTAFYRYTRLTSLNEVGADPSVFSVEPFDLHLKLAKRHLQSPHSMTTLSTHDTKRSEDTRARISVLAEVPANWAGTLAQLEALAPIGDTAFADLMWQALIGAWPLSRERAHSYVEKAAREAGDSTTWTDPDVEFESKMHAAVDAAFDSEDVKNLIERVVAGAQRAGDSNALSAKLLQLTMPGVPDVYQGTELWDRSLVDPDNRRPVDFELRQRLLADIDNTATDSTDTSDGEPGVGESDNSELGFTKLTVVAAALRLKRDHPEHFTGYEAVTVEGTAKDHAFAFDRGGAITVVTRLPLGLDRIGGWQDTTLKVEAGTYRDEISGKSVESDGSLQLSEVLSTLPVALLRKVS
ncbi:malto-oligosyltrehalose synthase [Neomicrococcus aestuarii]|uniref:Malto-oligosyltrehalose synthase n=1 Tax=Neomicrococcus aestuarii TaxID=556325 RepID=A0A1L2ZPT2_9MICC|nr:malto-oligosyltrehalose synthase [Neomicrococcus aestuarii]APF41167.1 malto-oligosyltrehalose synthase [Neomicrococcus aestuarii]